MRRISTIVAVVMLAPGARAAPKPEPLPEEPRTGRAFISLPALLGGGTIDGGGLVYGLRPELVFASVEPLSCGGSENTCLGHGWGGGLYLELLEASGHRVLGAGATLVRYGSSYTVAPSIGYYRKTDEGSHERGLTISLFGGRRGDRAFGPFDVPAGLRVEGRFGLDGMQERALFVMASIDIPLVIGRVVWAMVMD